MANIRRLTGSTKDRPLYGVEVVVSGIGRKTIRLGRVNERAAERFCAKIEDLATARRTHGSLAPDVAVWLAGLAQRSPKMYAKLVKAGLAEPREAKPNQAVPTLAEWFDKYLEQRREKVNPKTGLKTTEQTIALYHRTAPVVFGFFGRDTPIDRITAAQAAEWETTLAKTKVAYGGEDRRTLSVATYRLYIRHVKAIFNEAVRQELIQRSPFRGLVGDSPKHQNRRYISHEEADRVMDELPNFRWRLLFGLCRFAGLRCPSETHILRWSHVGWSTNSLTVYAPKTNTTRTTPIVPELRTLLQEAFDAAQPGGDDLLVTGLPRHPQETVDRAATRAGVTPWDDTMQALRRACVIDFRRRFPGPCVSAWLGHSEEVEDENYMFATDDMFAAATGTSLAPSIEKKAPQDAPQHGARPSRTDSHDAGANEDENPDLEPVAAGCGDPRESGWSNESHRP